MSTLITDSSNTPLPEPLQTWAQLRREQSYWRDENGLGAAFEWKKTPEGHAFWSHVYSTRPVEPHPSWEPQEPQEPQEPLTMEEIFVGLK